MTPSPKCSPIENLKNYIILTWGMLYNYKNDFQKIFSGLGKCDNRVLTEKGKKIPSIGLKYVNTSVCCGKKNTNRKSPKA